MDSSQSSSDAQRGIDPAKGRLPSCDRSIEGGRLGGPMPPVGYERDARVRTPAPPSGAPAAPGTSRALHFVKWTLAMVGVLALYLLLQIVVSLIGGTVIVSISFAVDGAGTEVGDALFDNGIQVVMAVSQLIAAAIFGLWWRRVRLGSFAGRRGAVASAGAPVMKTIASLLLVGFAAQFFVSGILGFVELFFPETMAEYAELMEDSAVGVFAIIQVISTVILAPLNEEIVCRGVMLEYAMRAVGPGWDPRHRARRRTVSVRAFWVANVLQALAFGVLHMNIIQGSYAFALGILQGWVFWRTGKLGYAMLLHFALNASSYLVAPLAPMVNVLPTPIVFAVFGGLLAGGIAMFERAWHVSDALPEVEVAEDDEEDGAAADDDAILGDVLPTDDAAARASAVSTGPGKGGSPL